MSLINWLFNPLTRCLQAVTLSIQAVKDILLKASITSLPNDATQFCSTFCLKNFNKYSNVQKGCSCV